ncbi:hypothetical protein DXX93_17580 [Thalassotalea euphylliae]|uniref:DUF4386 family protein n=1 Tax=Thalassotalea euphylliae TaxID=1655234 RepID=A0A3E0TV04_9GAMM|nr:hypothetical protein [Thalassotalea euphylliae]REL28197.1 hypothetical protein DXX93_17580 [Thalassotalea euphylliae]
MNTHSLLAAISAVICGSVFLFGYWSIRLLYPDFWSDISVRVYVVQTHSMLIQMWYFVVWILFGAALLVFNYGVLRTARHRHGVVEGIITLASFVSACYLFSIGLIEILSAQSLLSTGYWLGEDPNASYQALYILLTRIRGSIEFSSDIWFLLINLWLLAHRQLSHWLPILGVATTLFGFLLLTPTFAPYAVVYVCAKGGWYFVMAGWLLGKSQRVIASPN